MKINAATKAFALLGHPVGHSLSPPMQNAALEKAGINGVYLALDVMPGKTADMLRALRDLGFGGVNVTVPLKEEAFRAMDELDASAEMLGAVNTVEFTSNGLKGHNTDGPGFVVALKEAFGRDLRGLKVFILGAGGGGRAVAITAAFEGAAQVAIADVEPERAQGVAAEIENLFPKVKAKTVAADPETFKKAASEAVLTVNATPVGMRPEDESPLPPDSFSEGQFAFDLIYMYPETAFMKAAVGGGAESANGLGMLLHQGARAFEIWTGVGPEVEVMRQVLRTEVYGTA